MRKHYRLGQLEEACVLVGASLFCSLLVQHYSTQQSELPSEILCWAILPILFKFGEWSRLNVTELSYHYPDIRPTRFTPLWVIAANLAISCTYKAENGMIELSVSLEATRPAYSPN
jgi:hypothetical protein